MSDGIVSITTHPNRSLRDFCVADGYELSNARFSRLDRDDLVRKQLNGDRPNVVMDNATREFVNRLFDLPAVDRISLDERTVRVDINAAYRWSEVQEDIIAAICYSVGATSEIPQPVPAPKRVALQRNFPNRGLMYAYVSGAKLSNGDFGHIDRDKLYVHGIRAANFDIQADRNTMSLMERLFAISVDGEPVVESLSVKFAELGIQFTESWFVREEGVVGVIMNHLGWEKEQVEVISYYQSYEAFLAASSHPIDTLVLEA